MLEATDPCSETQLNSNWDLCYSMIPIMLRRVKEQYIRNLEIEGYFLVNYLHPVYQTLRKLYELKGGGATRICGIHAELLSAGDELRAWGLCAVLAAI